MIKLNRFVKKSNKDRALQLARRPNDSTIWNYIDEPDWHVAASVRAFANRYSWTERRQGFGHDLAKVLRSYEIDDSLIEEAGRLLLCEEIMEN